MRVVLWVILGIASACQLLGELLGAVLDAVLRPIIRPILRLVLWRLNGWIVTIYWIVAAAASTSLLPWFRQVSHPVLVLAAFAAFAAPPVLATLATFEWRRRRRMHTAYPVRGGSWAPQE